MPFPPDTLLMRMRLEGGLCPDCFGRQFWRGPQGGVAVNVQCDGCGAAFNVCVYGGQLIHCDRIGGDGDRERSERQPGLIPDEGVEGPHRASCANADTPAPLG